MRFRPSKRTLLVSLMWLSPAIVAAPRVAWAQTPKPAPKTALVTAVRGGVITLAVGSDDGAAIGQTFRIKRGNLSAKLQISAITASESTASIVENNEGFTVTVGDNATFIGQESLQAPSAPPQTLPVAPSAPATSAATTTTAAEGAATPQRAVITSVSGANATLNIGSADGAVAGAVYALPLEGEIKARLQIVTVRPNNSLASLTVLQEGFVAMVGNSARFVGIESLPLAPASPAVISEAPSTSPLSAATKTNSLPLAAMPVAALSGATATVTATEGQNVIISAGSAQGAKAASNLPILRDGVIIGLLRLQTVNVDSASGIVLWRDESLSPIAAGDTVGILGASSGVGAPAIRSASATDVPSAPVRYETGAANFAVPRAERAYELLAALAASGLIKSQPPAVFQDEGARRHNTSEDILFSRAHVAGFVREALANAGTSGEMNGRDRAAIAILSQDFRRELLQLGETPATLDSIRQGGRGIGFSGFSRATLAGGDTDATTRDPFSESYGQRRVKSGFDTRTNVFGQVGCNLSFYSSFDTGSELRNGSNAVGANAFRDNTSKFELRNAYVSYNADNLLRGLTVNLGRKEFWWGVGQFGTSILSDVPGGLNSLSTRFERGSYRLEGLYAPLGRGPAGQQRALYGQTISVKVNNLVRVGTSSTIVTVDDTFNPKYFLIAFSPLSLFLSKPDDERDSQARANAVLSGFVEAAVGKGARIYGEVLIDDLSRRASPAIENRTGLLVGGRFFNPKNPAKAGFTAEFARYNSYTYLPFPGGPSDTPDYFYQYRGAPLGHSITPIAPTNAGGAETLRFEGYYMPLKRLRLFGGVEFSDINSGDQNVRLANNQRGYSRQLIARVAASYNLSRSFSLTARAQQVRTDQPNFIFREPSRTDRHFSLELGRSF